MEELNILNELSNLDLSTNPVDEINKLIRQIGPTAGVGYTLHKRFSVFRARPHEHENEEFVTRDQLSYKPQKFNTTFQRASTPNSTMFYGSILPPEIGQDDINNAQVTSCFEASKTFRNNLFKSNEKITFSKWEVKEDIKLLIILPGLSNDRKDSFLNRMNDQLNQIMQSDREISIRTKLVNEYFAKQYANPNIRFDYDYMISALFTEMKLEFGFDGILYPSVKAQGRGYNICITPNAADNKLKLVAAGEGRIIKMGYISQIVNERESEIKDDTIPFRYNLVNNYTDPLDIIKRLEQKYI